MKPERPYAHTPVRPYLFVGLFLLAVAFLVWTVPANHTEAEDAYEYARRVEQEAGSSLFHLHHLLYLPLAQGVFRLLQTAGYAGRSFPVLIGISVLCGALALSLFAALLARRRGLAAALPFSLGLLFSYGFWRYACEAEIYAPALSIALAVFWMLSQPWTDRRRALAVSLLSAFGICIHVMNVIPLLGGVAVFYLVDRKVKRAVTHVWLTGAATALVYVVIAGTVGLYVPSGDSQPLEGGLNLAMFAKGAVGFSQAVVSGNFLFICPDFQQKIQELFPYRMFAEEVFMGNRISMPGFYAALGTLMTGLAGMLLLLLNMARRRFREGWPLEWNAPLVAALFWLTALAGVILVFEPGNPEMWVMALPPLWWMIACVLDRLSHPLRGSVFVGVILLGLHNWVGGLALIQSRKGDYNAQKASWLLDQNLAEALIVTAESHVFITYLNYWSDAKILSVTPVGTTEKTVAEIQKWPGPVYVLDEVFHPIPALANRFPGTERVLAQLAAGLRADTIKVHETGAGAVYQYIQ